MAEDMASFLENLKNKNNQDFKEILKVLFKVQRIDQSNNVIFDDYSIFDISTNSFRNGDDAENFFNAIDKLTLPEKITILDILKISSVSPSTNLGPKKTCFTFTDGSDSIRIDENDFGKG
jgi:archaellum biogenesis ATPase FlaH